MVACLFHTAKITIRALRTLVLFCSNSVGETASNPAKSCWRGRVTLPVLHTPDGTPGAFETSVIDSENRHVMIDIAVRGLVGAVLCRGPEIGALMEVVVFAADDVAGG